MLLGLGGTVYVLAGPTGAQLPPVQGKPPITAPNPATQPPTVATPVPATPPPMSEIAKGSLPAPPTIQAASAILVDAVSGQVLYEQNADVRRPMASTTKIMTALLFCECVKEDAVITASKHASETKESSLHLKPGEKISGRDLLHAMLMRSANDSCVAAAEHVAGTEAAFVEKMNQRALQLGAANTHFVNPHGLHHKEHYTTARDLATIARAAILEPRINEVTGTQRYKIARSMNKLDLHLRNHSHFLGKFPGADGIKTGYTIPAGHCYVGSATWGNWRLISVVLKSPDYVHETALLMKYGFTHFEPHLVAKAGDAAGTCPVKGGVKPDIRMSVKNPLQVILPKGENSLIEPRTQLTPVTAPLTAGQTVGTLGAYLDGKLICTSPLVTNEACPAAPVALQIQQKMGFLGWLWPGPTILTLGLVSLFYGKRNRTRFATSSKGTRRRRRRFPQGL